MNRKQTIGIALILLGVASLAIFLFQANSYITYNNLAGMMKEESAKTLAALKTDPTQLTALGITASDVDQYGTKLIESNIQTIYLQANGLVPAMALDFVLGIALCFAGIRLSAEHS
jgi:hypothetical protein